MGEFLVVDDKESRARATARLVQKLRPARAVWRWEEALDALAPGHTYAGFVFDLRINENSGIRLLEVAQRHYASTPSLLLSERPSQQVLSEVFLLGSSCICHPFTAAHVQAFSRRVLAYEAARDNLRLLRELEVSARRWGLTTREAEVLTSAVAGHSRDHFLHTAQIARGTYKRHVTSLLRKSDALTLEQLAADVLRAALDRTAT